MNTEEQPTAAPMPRTTVAVDVKTWEALRRQLARMVAGWRVVGREAERVLGSCRHADGCPADVDRARPCLPACPDRETFLSALVVEGNARQFAALRAAVPTRIGTEYRPPPRETFDAIVTELEVLRTGRDILGELEQLARAEPQLDAENHPLRGVEAEAPMTRLVDPDPGEGGERPELEDSSDRDEVAEGDEG